MANAQRKYVNPWIAEWKTHFHTRDLIEGPHGMSWEAVGKESVGSIKAK